MKTADILGQNYTGPFVSNGKFQTSVVFGDQEPLTKLDSYSRLHDSAYGLYGPGIERKAADSLYMMRANGLGGATASLAGGAVVYGNALARSANQIAQGVSSGFRLAGLPGAFAGLVYSGAKNAYELHDYLVNGAEAKDKILQAERGDPFPQYQLGPQIVNSDQSLLKGLRPRTSAKGLKVDGEIPTTPDASPARPPGVYTGRVDANVPVDGMQTSVSPPFQRLGSGEYTTMVKKQAKKTQVVVKMPQPPKQKPKKAKAQKSKVPAMVGAVSSINTAPVSVGNSVRGCTTSIISSSKTGITVRGRDFMFAPIGTGSVTTWTVCGGSPLSPAAFADTQIANYMRTYAKFRFKAFTAHYITTSPTSSNGSVMFYYGKDRSSVFLNQTSPQLLGFVLSDSSTVIGPQWVNHSATMEVSGDWKLTDYGMHDGLEEYADGELFLLSKTSTTDSPGYVMFDYIIEFAEHQLQPRLLTFPIPRIQWFQTNIGLTGAAVTGGTQVAAGSALVIKGNNISGSSASLPSGVKIGDVYKIVFDITNSSPAGWTGCTAANLLMAGVAGYNGDALTLTDGFTLYAVCGSPSTGGFSLYENATQAFTATYAASNYNHIVYGVSATITFNLQCWMSYVGSLTSVNLAPNF